MSSSSGTVLNCFTSIIRGYKGSNVFTPQKVRLNARDICTFSCVHEFKKFPRVVMKNPHILDLDRSILLDNSLINKIKTSTAVALLVTLRNK